MLFAFPIHVLPKILQFREKRKKNPYTIEIESFATSRLVTNLKCTVIKYMVEQDAFSDIQEGAPIIFGI